jgi:predicted nucleic acid-binding protein
MKEFFDTSVLVGAFWRGHPQHEASLKLVSAAKNLKHFRLISPDIADRIRTP